MTEDGPLTLPVRPRPPAPVRPEPDSLAAMRARFDEATARIEAAGARFTAHRMVAAANPALAPRPTPLAPPPTVAELAARVAAIEVSLVALAQNARPDPYAARIIGEPGEATTLAELIETCRAAGYLPAGRAIVAAVSRESGIPVEAITGASRAAAVVRARHAAIRALFVHRPDLSSPQIGRLIGDRDHSTVLHALRKLGLSYATRGAAS